MTETAAACWSEALIAALVDRRAVVVAYHGRRRVVCPHAIGSKDGRAMLLAYQIGGETSTGSLPSDPARRWRCLYIDEIDDVAGDDGLWQSAPNYNPRRPFPAADAVAAAV